MHNDSDSPTWIITGASSGIGLAVAQAAAERGDNVVALARTTDALDGVVSEHGEHVMALATDVRKRADLDDAVARTVERFGRIDILHNNAGYGLFGAVEESTDEEARAIFDTNVFGLLNVLRATLPVMREQRSGHVLQGSSFYGRVTHPGVGLLSATKYAVEGLSAALVDELEPLGIKVTMVEPGPTATPFGGNFHRASEIADYDGTVRKVERESAELPPEAFDAPERVAEAILAVAGTAEPPLRLATGSNGLEQMRSELQAQLDELEAWRQLSERVDGAPAAA